MRWKEPTHMNCIQRLKEKVVQQELCTRAPSHCQSLFCFLTFAQQRRAWLQTSLPCRIVRYRSRHSPCRDWLLGGECSAAQCAVHKHRPAWRRCSLWFRRALSSDDKMEKKARNSTPTIELEAIQRAGRPPALKSYRHTDSGSPAQRVEQRHDVHSRHRTQTKCALCTLFFPHGTIGVGLGPRSPEETTSANAIAIGGEHRQPEMQRTGLLSSCTNVADGCTLLPQDMLRSSGRQ